jgi:hypothetical protein
MWLVKENPAPLAENDEVLRIHNKAIDRLNGGGSSTPFPRYGGDVHAAILK